LPERRFHKSGLAADKPVSEIDKVGRAKRLFLREWAGRASLTADVEYIDGNTGIVMGRYEVVGRSGNNEFTGVTGRAVEKTAEAIVAVMAEGYSWKPRAPGGEGAGLP
jgi:hypothetical protein